MYEYVQDRMIDEAEQYLIKRGLQYFAPTKNTQKDDEPSLVVVPCYWGKERAIIAIDAYADENDDPVLEIVGYLPAGVTKDWNDTMMLAVANQENMDSTGLIFAVDEGRHMTFRAVVAIDNDTFPNDRFDRAYRLIETTINDYRSAARNRGNFPEPDPKKSVVITDLG